MLIYSIVPYEQMFPAGAQEAAAPTACRRVPGGLLEVGSSPGGAFVSRLISTDPRLYLNPAYLPGTPCPGPRDGRTDG